MIRRLAKTDVIDSIAAARALLAEPTLGPAEPLEIYDPPVAKIEAVLEHRHALVEARTLMLHYTQDPLASSPQRSATRSRQWAGSRRAFANSKPSTPASCPAPLARTGSHG